MLKQEDHQSKSVVDTVGRGLGHSNIHSLCNLLLCDVASWQQTHFSHFAIMGYILNDNKLVNNEGYT